MLDVGKWDPVLGRLLVTLEESRNNLPTGCEEEIGFLSDLLQSRELHALVKVHNTIAEKDDRFHPTLSNAVEVVEDVMDMLSSNIDEDNSECMDLFCILQSPHLQGLFYSHDIIAQKDYMPKLPQIPAPDGLDLDDTEETIKIVQLVKSNEPLGATIKKDEETGKITIARVMHGGAADRSGLIFPGDEVVEVNCLSVEGKTPDDVLQILKNSEGTITFKLVPADAGRQKRESKVRVRCLFNFESTGDPHIPCKDAGLDFFKGDVLHVVSQDDIYWWQARREGDRSMRAGLIPSRALQERRAINARTAEDENGVDCSPCKLSVGTLTSGVVKSDDSVWNKCTKHFKKIAYDLTENNDYDREEIPTYEEVAKLYPRPGFHRPIVLIGPPGVGRNELKRRLIDLDPAKYKTTIPYTSRAQRPGELDGKEYFFVNRVKMEEDIALGNFLEFGEYKGNLYGTSSENVRSIVNAGLHCVLNPHSQALKLLRKSEFKPYIVYVKPPAFEDEEFNEIIRSSERIEFLYGHWFDETIVNDDLTKAFEKLVKIVKKVENEALWVPVSWVQ